MSEGAYDPHGWMLAGPAAPSAARREGIRAWYERTTRKSRKAAVWATAASLTTMGIMWLAASFQTLARLQTFNGALTIPLLGGVWIFTFIFMFLVPSREASFRGQEAIEEGVDLVRAGFRDEIAPMVQVWKRIGDHMETEIPRIIRESRETLEETRSAAKRLREAVEKNEKFSEEAKPAVDALTRISDRLEAEIQTGLIEDIRTAAQSVRDLSGVPKDSTQPDFGVALAAVRRAKAKALEGRQA